MIRPYGTGAATVRHIVYTERDSATGVYTYTDVFGGQAGFPDLDVERVGANIGSIGVVGHTPNRLGLWDGSAFQVATFAPGDDPSLQFGDATTWLATSGSGRDQYEFWNSTDGDITFNNWDSVKDFHQIWSGHLMAVLNYISKSPNEQNVVYY